MISGEKVRVTAIHSDKSKKGLMMKVKRKEGVMSGGCDALEQKNAKPINAAAPGLGTSVCSFGDAGSTHRE